MAIGCAISMVAQRNPLYSAISLIGVFISLACLYVTLSAPFIAAVQVIVYAAPPENGTPNCYPPHPTDVFRNLLT